MRFEKKPGNLVLLIKGEGHVQHAPLAIRWENHPLRTWFRHVEVLNSADLGAESFEEFNRFFEWQTLAHLLVEQALDARIIGSVDQLDEMVCHFGVSSIHVRFENKPGNFILLIEGERHV